MLHTPWKYPRPRARQIKGVARAVSFGLELSDVEKMSRDCQCEFAPPPKSRMPRCNAWAQPRCRTSVDGGKGRGPGRARTPLGVQDADSPAQANRAVARRSLDSHRLSRLWIERRGVAGPRRLKRRFPSKSCSRSARSRGQEHDDE